jgi:hypothetical protein
MGRTRRLIQYRSKFARACDAAPPCHEQIEVAEIELARGVEVLVADIAAAPDHKMPVHDPALVVHAVVEAVAGAQEFYRITEPAQGAESERVVQADLDGRVPRERRQRAFGPPHVEVVQQQPHPHAAVGRPEHLSDQQPARHVLVPNVIL